MLLYVHSFLSSLAVTVFIETVTIFFLVRRIYKIEDVVLPTSILLAAGVAASSLTVPYVWFVFPYLFFGNLILGIAVAEIFAFSVETIFYKLFLGLKLKQATALSLVANVLSFVVAYVLHAYR